MEYNPVLPNKDFNILFKLYITINLSVCVSAVSDVLPQQLAITAASPHLALDLHSCSSDAAAHLSCASDAAAHLSCASDAAAEARPLLPRLQHSTV